MSANTPSSDRVERLLAELSTKEKVGQLIQYFYFALPAGIETVEGLDPFIAKQPQMVEAALADGSVGSLLFVTDPDEVNRLQKLAIEGNAHGIPLLFGFDVIHGLRTIFPVPIALAASWDADTIERAQTVAAREARAVGIHWAFAPMVDIARDPRWGRIVEGAGEDPLLGSVVAAAQVRGFQGDRLGADGHIIAGPKHFAGYGAALGGRDYDEVDLSDQEFYNTYLPPFKAAIDVGAGNIMSAYMDLNGVPASGNHWLLTEVLRDQLGFDGFVVTDANAAKDLETHHFAADTTDSGVRALNAGVDMEMGIFQPAFEHLTQAIDDGRVDIARVDEAVRRILTVKEQLGLFEQPYVDVEASKQVLADPAHRDEAQRAAERSAVLLRNEGGILPLSPDALQRVAVLGPLADSKRDTVGPWVFDFDLDETVSIAEGIKARLSDAVSVAVEPGIATPTRTFPSMFDSFGLSGPSTPEDFDPEASFARAVELASHADVAVLVLGEQQDMIGENASRSELTLPGDQQRLLEAVVATGTPVALVLMNGRPLEIGWAAENVPGILDVWYPGTRGGDAVAALLFGDVAPAGKLPFTWPRSVGQVPMHHAITRSHAPQDQGKRYWNEASTPLFPFGHGLSYTSFAYGEPTVDAATAGIHDTVTVSVDVTNTGDRDGVEVVQLYLHQRFGTSSRPLRQLKAFERVEIPAGETRTVRLTVGPDERRYWSAATRDWVLDATVFDVWVGGDATAEPHAEFTITDD
ncbi:glycoside hydrolase family 3 N-terminal domain-containing protein [Humibacter ginsenosidimutans]|uniref:Exo-alpha-(1->6)-L-arabinopyranosidase n=1 Tax=Humibacter ginsenosidimutans TaxID=2599293 RepID=A0A5B8M7G9_9MICO|nr:glycoside hydrolase family 3 N-terminal domain-containing protein [Humibacter ginsenosidimutans]QDZ15390.1 beta-glucosidase [Humibacter ginsenosidimutans]